MKRFLWILVAIVSTCAVYRRTPSGALNRESYAVDEARDAIRSDLEGPGPLHYGGLAPPSLACRELDYYEKSRDLYDSVRHANDVALIFSVETELTSLQTKSEAARIVVPRLVSYARANRSLSCFSAGQEPVRYSPLQEIQLAERIMAESSFGPDAYLFGEIDQQFSRKDLDDLRHKLLAGTSCSADLLETRYTP